MNDGTSCDKLHFKVKAFVDYPVFWLFVKKRENDEMMKRNLRQNEMQKNKKLKISK